MTRRPWFALALAALCLALPAHAKVIKGTVKLRDGRVLKDVEYEVRGKKVWVKRRFGEVTYKQSQILKLIPAEVESVASETTEEPGSDWDARFRLVAPDGWTVVSPDLPTVRAQLRHDQRNAVFMVRVRPALKRWSYERAEKGKVQEAISDDLNVFFQNVQTARVEVGELHGSPVYRIDGATVEPYGASKDEKRVIHEVRFQRYGLEYTLCVSIAKDDAGALKSELDPVFESFSFLPTIEYSKDSYSDHARGVLMSVAAEGWQMSVEPFNDDRPFALSKDGGRATLIMRVIQGKDPRELIEGHMRDRKAKNKQVKQDKIESDKINGAEVVRYSYEAFRKGERKLRGFYGFGAKAGRHLLIFEAQAPLSAGDSRDLVREIEGLLNSVRLGNDDRLAEAARAAKAAWGLVSEGASSAKAKRYGDAVSKYTEAIEAAPKFALAFYLRGLAKKHQRDFDGYKEDLEKAGEIAPNGGYTKALASAQRDEAMAALKSKEFGRALPLWASVFNSDPNKKTKDGLIKALKGHWTAKKKAKEYDSYRDLDKLLRRPASNDADIAKELLGVIYEAGRLMARDGKISSARKALRAAKKITSKFKRHKEGKNFNDLYKRAKSDLERAEENRKR